MSPKPAPSWPDSATILERSRGVFFAQWEELLRFRRAVMKSADLDDIHDLRVATRRFRAALELFYPFMPKGPKTELRKTVRKLTRVLGGLRNVDEALLFFKARVQDNVPIKNTLVGSLSKLRQGELKRIRKELEFFDHHKLDLMVREMVAGVNSASISQQNSISLLAYFSDVSIRLYLPIFQLKAVSTEPERHSIRHVLRIGIKKWRYFFEIISLILDRDYNHFLELLKEYQSSLGRMNDIAAFESLLGTLKLNSDEREYAGAILKAEEARLLGSFAELVERKPLTYIFLI